MIVTKHFIQQIIIKMAADNNGYAPGGHFASVDTLRKREIFVFKRTIQIKTPPVRIAAGRYVQP